MPLPFPHPDLALMKPHMQGEGSPCLLVFPSSNGHWGWRYLHLLPGITDPTPLGYTLEQNLNSSSHTVATRYRPAMLEH